MRSIIWCARGDVGEWREEMRRCGIGEVDNGESRHGVVFYNMRGEVRRVEKRRGEERRGDMAWDKAGVDVRKASQAISDI